MSGFDTKKTENKLNKTPTARVATLLIKNIP